MEEEDLVLGLTLQMPSEGPAGDPDAVEGGESGDLNAHREAFEAAAMGGVNSNDIDDNADANAGGVAEGYSDEQLLATRKKDAKALGKKLYKRWKKLQKRHAGSKSKDKKRRSSDDGKKSSSNTKRDGSKKKSKLSGSKRKRDAEEASATNDTGVADDVLEMLDEREFIATTTATTKRGRRLEATVERVAKTSARKGLTPQQRFAKAQETAKALVDAMRKAQQQDETVLVAKPAKRGPPLHRIAMKNEVQACCARQALLGPLIDCGILAELSNWLYDFDRGEPAPFELRSAALDILLRIPIEGESILSARKNGGAVDSEDLMSFRGLTREELLPTNLGRAVNTLRLHQQETSSNRSKCVKLLERFSKAYSGPTVAPSSASRGGSSGEGVVTWKCKNDPTVRSPFDVVQTDSQSFQQAFMKPDPQDPTSYNNLLPWRPPARCITNLSGDIGGVRR